MKTKFFFLVGLLLLLSSGGQAQIGTNPKGNVLEYGKPVNEHEDCGYLVQVFDVKGLRYEIFYESDVRAVLIRIRSTAAAEKPDGMKSAGITDEDLAKVLSRNTEQSKWLEKPATLPGMKLWEREDAKAFAEYDAETGLMNLAYRSAVPRRIAVDPGNWTPLQLCLAQTLGFPSRQCVYGLKAGFMSGQGRVVGVEGSVVLAATPEVCGFKGALVNLGDGSEGAHFGVVNVECDFGGMQAGLVNVLSGKAPGTPPPNAFQFGLVNYARDLDGFQFGLVNVVENGILPFMVIFNFDSNDDESVR